MKFLNQLTIGILLCFFYILLSFSVTLVPLPFILTYLEVKSPHPDPIPTLLLSSIISVILAGILLVAPINAWKNHAKDLGTIATQQELIQVYEKEVKQLNTLLSEFKYPEGALLNKDTPVASLVNRLSHWQELIANTRLAEAEAKKSIAQRSYGPMSGVISFLDKSK